MTAFAIIIACIAFMIVVASVRGNPGRAVADTALLVILIGIITIVDLIFGQFMDTGDAGRVLQSLSPPLSRSTRCTDCSRRSASAAATRSCAG